MSRRLAAIVSFRLGGPDGVSVQAATWATALQRLGYDIRRVAGELPDGPRKGDSILPGLAVDARGAVGAAGQTPVGARPPTHNDLYRALDGAELVVVENLLSLPVNLGAAHALAEFLAWRLRAGDGRVILHHHDLAWQRPETELLHGLPPDLPGAVHVAVNEFSRRELAERGFDAVVIRNAFDLDAPQGRRAETRVTAGLWTDDLVVLQPTRAVERKNIPAALRLCEGLATRFPDRRVVYWLPGPAEDGYAEALEGILAAAPVEVIRHHPAHLPLLRPAGNMRDAYAACDLVVFPSTEGEGFGQPVIESVWARKPLAVAGYRALDEIVQLGFSFLPVGDADAVAEAIRIPDPGTFDAHLNLARHYFSIEALTAQLEVVIGR